jgi:hypothetical protein
MGTPGKMSKIRERIPDINRMTYQGSLFDLETETIKQVEALWSALEVTNQRLDAFIEEECVTVSDSGMDELLDELVKIIRLHDGHKFGALAKRYDAFEMAVDKAGDFRPVRLNVADLIDELLCKYSGDWVRSRRD